MPAHKGQTQGPQKQEFMIVEQHDQTRYGSAENKRSDAKPVAKNKKPPRRSSRTLNKTFKTPVNMVTFIRGNRHKFGKDHEGNWDHGQPPEQYFFKLILTISRRHPKECFKNNYSQRHPHYRKPSNNPHAMRMFSRQWNYMLADTAIKLKGPFELGLQQRQTPLSALHSLEAETDHMNFRDQRLINPPAPQDSDPQGAKNYQIRGFLAHRLSRQENCHKYFCRSQYQRSPQINSNEKCAVFDRLVSQIDPGHPRGVSAHRIIIFYIRTVPAGDKDPYGGGGKKGQHQKCVTEIRPRRFTKSTQYLRQKQLAKIAF